MGVRPLSEKSEMPRYPVIRLSMMSLSERIPMRVRMGASLITGSIR